MWSPATSIHLRSMRTRNPYTMGHIKEDNMIMIKNHLVTIHLKFVIHASILHAFMAQTTHVRCKCKIQRDLFILMD